jgi:hypothetical protein
MEFYYDQLRLAYSKIFNYYMNNLWNVRTKLRNRHNFTCNKAQQLPTAQTEFEFIKMLDDKACKLISNDAQKHLRVTKLLMYVNSEYYSSVDQLLRAYYDLCDFNVEILAGLKVDDTNIVGIVPAAHKSDQIVIDDVKVTSARFKFSFDNSGEAYDENEFIESAMMTWQNILGKFFRLNML